MSAIAAAFDAAAPTYDRDFGLTRVAVAFRERVHERLGRLFTPGMSVLDLGCGTGEDAARLASRGVRVHGIDPSPRMVEHARARQAPAARFSVARAEDVGGLVETFDGAYSNFGALNCADLAAAGAALARVLRPGAPVLLSLMPPRPLPALVAGLRKGRVEPRGVRVPHVAGLPVPASYPGPRAAQRALGPAFAWSSCRALGVLAPGPSHAAWADRHPRAFSLLFGLERLVARWPLLRGLGDHYLLEGRRL